MEVKVKVTKEILKQAAICGRGPLIAIGNNCPVALALKDMFPHVWVKTGGLIVELLKEEPEEINHSGFYPAKYDSDIYLEFNAKKFIESFDMATPNQRLMMSPFQFTIEIPDYIIEKIGLNEMKKRISNSQTLELIEN